MLLSLLANSEAPSWAAQVLVQFPIVALVFLAVWWAQRTGDKRHDKFMDRLQVLFDQHRATATEQTRQLSELGTELKKEFDRTVREVKDAHESALKEMQARHAAELERLGRAHAAHVRSLNAEIRRLVESRQDRRNPGGEIL